MAKSILWLLTVVAWVSHTSAEHIYNEVVDHNQREDRLGLFTVVRFPNNPCMNNDNTEMGTCMTDDECTKAKGTSIGRCGNNFGVCCQILLKDDGSKAEKNNTILVNPNYPSADTTQLTRTYMIQRMNDNICHLRLDFLEFELGNPDNTGACVTDMMTVPMCGTGTNMPENLCGKNTNQHVYLDFSSSSTCSVRFVLGAGGGNRKWKIKVSQIECGDASAPPKECLKYYTGAKGKVMSFNFQTDQSSQHLLEPTSHKVCIRQEQGMCQITYTPCTDNNLAAGQAFAVSAAPAGAAGADPTNCDPGADGFLDFPLMYGPNTMNPPQPGATNLPRNRLCGQRFNVDLANPGAGQTDASLSTTVLPFGFISFLKTSTPAEEGYCLDYKQDCNT